MVSGWEKLWLHVVAVARASKITGQTRQRGTRSWERIGEAT